MFVVDNIIKMVPLPKAIYRLKAIPIKIPMAFFTEVGEAVLKFIGKNKRFRISKAILSNKSDAEGITIFFLSTLQSYRNKKNMVLASKHEDQWSRVEDTETNSSRYSHLFLHKIAKNIEEKTTF